MVSAADDDDRDCEDCAAGASLEASDKGSRPVSATVPGPQSQHAPSIAAELHAVLDRLLDADLSGLSGPEHEVLVKRVLRAEHRLHAGVLDAVAAFDAADVAAGSRHRSTKRWIELSTWASASTASQLTRSARALRDHLPATRDALAHGRISAQHASAVVSVMSTIGAEHAQAAEPLLLDLARQFSPSVVREAAARIHQAVDPEGAEKSLHAAHAKRGVTLSVGGAFGYLSGILDLESTELLQSALMPLMATSGPDDDRTAPQLRADALLDLAKRGLDGGLGTQVGGERPHVSIVIDEAALRSGVGSVTLPWTGAVLPAASARRWACDAQVTPVLARLLPPPSTTSGTGGSSSSDGPSSGSDGRSGSSDGPSGSPTSVAIGGGWLPLDVGRAARTVTTAQTKALRVRDGGCVHPGCSRTSAFCDAHHVQHWADGGPTNLDNLVLLCRHHHRTLHQGLWTLAPDGGQPGRFWAGTGNGVTPAQTTADRSPPLMTTIGSDGEPISGLNRDPARSLWQ